MVNSTASKDKNKKTSDRGGGEWTRSSSYCKVAVRENGHSQNLNGTRSSSTQTGEEEIEEERSLDDNKADESENVLPEVQDNGGDQGTEEEADEKDSAGGGEEVAEDSAEEKPDPENGEKDEDDEDVVVLVPSGKELDGDETESDAASQKADNENPGDKVKIEEEAANEERDKEEENNDEGKLCEKEIEENEDTSKEQINASDYEKTNNDYGNRKENEEGGEKDDSSPKEIQDSGKSEEKLIGNNGSPPVVVVGAGNDDKEEEEERGVRLNPVPWFRPEVPMTLKASVEMTRDRRYLKGEVPSANGLCSARGMAKASCCP